MHAKVTVADDVVFVGSFNLSRSGERNAENVLELADAAPLAEQASKPQRGSLPACARSVRAVRRSDRASRRDVVLGPS